MPKKLSLKLDLKGKQVEENFAIGDPKPGNNPLKFQLEVINRKFGAILEPESMKMVQEIDKIAQKNRDSAENIFSYIYDNFSGRKLFEEIFFSDYAFEISKTHLIQNHQTPNKNKPENQSQAFQPQNSVTK